MGIYDNIWWIILPFGWKINENSTDFKTSIDWNGTGRGCSPAKNCWLCHGRFAATSSAFQSLWSNIIQYPSVVVKQTTSNNTCTWYLKRFSVLQYISVHDQDLSTNTSRTSHHPSDIATVSTMVPSRGCGMSMRIEVMHVVTSQTAVKIPHAFRIKDYQGRSRSRR